MRCQSCQEEFPSAYHFAPELTMAGRRVCVTCAPKLGDAWRDLPVVPEAGEGPPQISRRALAWLSHGAWFAAWGLPVSLLLSEPLGHGDNGLIAVGALVVVAGYAFAGCGLLGVGLAIAALKTSEPRGLALMGLTINTVTLLLGLFILAQVLRQF